MKTLVMLGSSSLAKELYWYIYDMRTRGIDTYEDYIFINDQLPESQTLEISSKTFSIQNHWNFNKKYEFIVAIGNPIVKKIMVEKALKAGLNPAETIIHPDAKIYGQDNQIGKGGFITPGSIFTTNIKIGDYIIINLNTTVGHDVILEDYVTINPGCQISGYVKVKEGTLIGTGTSIREGIVIGARNIIGAQCAVVKNIDETDGIYGGVPAKKIKSRI